MKVEEKRKGSYLLDAIEKLIIESHFEMDIAVSVNLYGFWYYHNEFIDFFIGAANFWNCFLLFLSIFVLVAMPIYSYNLVKVNFNQIHKAEIRKKFYNHVGSLNHKSFSSLMLLPIFLLRRIIISIILVLVHMYPSLQITILTVLSVAFFIFLAAIKPYSEINDNRQEAFNELCILFCMYIINTFMLSTDAEFSNSLSMVFIGICILNVLNYVTQTIYNIFIYFYSKCIKIKEKNSKLKKQEDENGLINVAKNVKKDPWINHRIWLRENKIDFSNFEKEKVYQTKIIELMEMRTKNSIRDISQKINNQRKKSKKQRLVKKQVMAVIYEIDEEESIDTHRIKKVKEIKQKWETKTELSNEESQSSDDLQNYISIEVDSVSEKKITKQKSENLTQRKTRGYEVGSFGVKQSESNDIAMSIVFVLMNIPTVAAFHLIKSYIDQLVGSESKILQYVSSSFKAIKDYNIKSDQSVKKFVLPELDKIQFEISRSEPSEFLQQLIEKINFNFIHDKQNLVLKTDQKEKFILQQFKLQNFTLLSKIFGSLIKSTIRCSICENEIHEYQREFVLDIQLNHQGRNSIQRHLDQMFSEQLYEKQFMFTYFCQSCNKNTPYSTFKQDILSAPFVLGIKLNKPRNIENETKISKMIDLTEFLRRPNFIKTSIESDKNQFIQQKLDKILVKQKSIKYRLKSIILQNKDRTLFYPCIMRKNKWYEYKDGKCQIITQKQVIQQAAKKANMLFYQAQKDVNQKDQKQ